MPTLENDCLVFRFPQIETEASFSIDLQRTLRIPDTDETYPLPPGLGRFPVRHVEDYVGRLPETTSARGGVILPMWQAEALWLNFRNNGFRIDADAYLDGLIPPSSPIDLDFETELPFPVAIKVAAGKINAVTGEKWCQEFTKNPQNYMVSPEQPWLDGFAVEKGIVRQFVAMPIGEGYSVEEQLTEAAEWGGLQISVAPLKRHIWTERKAEWLTKQLRRLTGLSARAINGEIETPLFSVCSELMAMGAGGRMRQSIEVDPFQPEDWDFDAADRVFVTLAHAKDWLAITGEAASDEPPSAKTYTYAGLPWFEHYGKDQTAAGGGAAFAALKSVGASFKAKTGATMPHSHDINIEKIIPLGDIPIGPRPVHQGNNWDESQQ